MQIANFSVGSVQETRKTDNPAIDASHAELTKKIQKKAEEFEAVFIAEMLKFAQIGMPKTESSGPSETEAFEGFMREAYAEAIVKRGGFGLADDVAKHLLKAALGSDQAAEQALNAAEKPIKEKNFLNILEGERSYGNLNNV